MKIDNFALTTFQACPAKYFLRIQEGWTTRRKSSALGFGGALHEGLAEWYKTGDIVKALQAINTAWPLNVPIDDYRTKEKCLRTMAEYAKAYPAESWSVVGAPANPMIECVFTLPTGLYLNCRNCGVSADSAGFCEHCRDLCEEIEYGGIFDGLIEFGDTIYILEHKTTSQMGAYYFTQFKPNNQVTGYVWGGQQLMGDPEKGARRVGGALVNGIGVYKASATKFEREITTRSKEEIAEWLVNLRNSCQMIRDCERRGYWPMHTPSCTMYGRCEYHDVHVLNPVERPKRLELDYVREEWSHEQRAGSKEEPAA